MQSKEELLQEVFRENGVEVSISTCSSIVVSEEQWSRIAEQILPFIEPKEDTQPQLNKGCVLNCKAFLEQLYQKELKADKGYDNQLLALRIVISMLEQLQAL